MCAGLTITLLVWVAAEAVCPLLHQQVPPRYTSRSMVLMSCHPAGLDVHVPACLTSWGNEAVNIDMADHLPEMPGGAGAIRSPAHKSC